MKKFQIIKHGAPRTYAAEFRDLSEMHAFVMAGHAYNAKNQGHADSTRGATACTWTNDHDAESITRAMHNPPPSAATMADSIADISAIIDHQETRRKLQYRQEEGEELDPVAWIQRDCDGWTRITKAKQKSTRIFSIAINGGIHQAGTAAQLAARGAAACALVDAIEDAGHRCEVWFTNCAAHVEKTYKQKATKRGSRKTEYNPSDEEADRYVIKTLLKPADAPLDLDGIALAIGEIGFHRLITIPARLMLCTGEARDSSGRTCELPNHIAREFDIIIDKTITNAESAAEMITAQLAKLKG